MGNHTVLLGICSEEATETEDTRLKKHIMLASLMLALLTLTASLPVVKAVTTYYWDGVRFVDGIYIAYPHPDRDYYGISPFNGWSKKGSELYHNQIDRTTSVALPFTHVLTTNLPIDVRMLPDYGGAPYLFPLIVGGSP